MTTIRPNPLPAAAPQPAAQGQSLDSARQAAQRAFFAAALGQAPAPATPLQAATKAAAQPVAETRPAPVPRMPDPAAEPPTRVLRPGSLLDIRV